MYKVTYHDEHGNVSTKVDADKMVMEFGVCVFYKATKQMFMVNHKDFISATHTDN